MQTFARVAISAAALIALSLPVSAQTPTKVSAGVIGVTSDGGTFIAQERGYFREQGLDVDLQTFTSLPELLPLVATNRLDVGAGANGAALYNALANNTGIKIVADNGSIQPNNRDGGALMVRNALAGQIKTPADLKGRKIAALAVSCVTSQLYIEKVLAGSGVSPKEVDYVAMGFPDMVAALANGSVDLAILVEPFVTLAKARNIATSWRGLGEIYPGQQANVIIYSSAFAAKTDVAKKYATARLKGVRDYNDAFYNNKNRDAVVAIMAKYTLVKDPAMYAQMSILAVNPDGRPGTDTLVADQDWFVKNGCVRTAADVRGATDTSFVDAAVATLGKY